MSECPIVTRESSLAASVSSLLSAKLGAVALNEFSNLVNWQNESSFTRANVFPWACFGEQLADVRVGETESVAAPESLGLREVAPLVAAHSAAPGELAIEVKAQGSSVVAGAATSPTAVVAVSSASVGAARCDLDDRPEAVVAAIVEPAPVTVPQSTVSLESSTVTKVTMDEISTTSETAIPVSNECEAQRASFAVPASVRNSEPSESVEPETVAPTVVAMNYTASAADVAKVDQSAELSSLAMATEPSAITETGARTAGKTSETGQTAEPVMLGAREVEWVGLDLASVKQVPNSVGRRAAPQVVMSQSVASPVAKTPAVASPKTARSLHGRVPAESVASELRNFTQSNRGDNFRDDYLVQLESLVVELNLELGRHAGPDAGLESDLDLLTNRVLDLNLQNLALRQQIAELVGSATSDQ